MTSLFSLVTTSAQDLSPHSSAFLTSHLDRVQSTHFSGHFLVPETDISPKRMRPGGVDVDRVLVVDDPAQARERRVDDSLAFVQRPLRLLVAGQRTRVRQRADVLHAQVAHARHVHRAVVLQVTAADPAVERDGAVRFRVLAEQL